MRHPFWILNSALLLFFFIALDFIFFSRYNIPSQKSIKPEEYVKPVAKSITEVNIEKIYENDLFNTYVKEMPKPEIPVAPIVTMPEPPIPHRATIPEEPKPQFLEPLPISLKGTILTSDDENQNRAIIAYEETEKERMYKIGDTIEDAKLTRILHNKIVIVRSNGQQEIIYLREKDTKLDPLYATLVGWDSILERVADTRYIIYPHAFVSRIKTLGQFIDMLDLTTVFKEGKTIGTRAGYLSENSLGIALGLQQGDIIVSIDGIPATSTANRVKIYKEIISLNVGDSINVILLRDGRELELTYILKKKEKQLSPGVQDLKQKSKREQEKIDLLKQQHHVAPTAKEIRIRERENMRKKGTLSSQFIKDRQ